MVFEAQAYSGSNKVLHTGTYIMDSISSSFELEMKIDKIEIGKLSFSFLYDEDKPRYEMTMDNTTIQFICYNMDNSGTVQPIEFGSLEDKKLKIHFSSSTKGLDKANKVRNFTCTIYIDK